MDVGCPVQQLTDKRPACDLHQSSLTRRSLYDVL